MYNRISSTPSSSRRPALLPSTSVVLTFVFLMLVQLLVSLPPVGAVPKGFIAEPVSSAYAIAGTFAINPRNDWKPMMILVEKGGAVRVIEDPDNGGDGLLIMNLDDKMCLNVERGLQTVAVHPNFRENRYVYLYYNVFKEGCLADDSQDGPWNVVARFVMDPVTLELNYDEREEIWRGAPLFDAMHNGGGMVFGNDGKLWLAVGDSGEPENASKLGTTHGKLLRLNDDGTTPDDNPYTQANGYEAYHCGSEDLGGVLPNDASEQAVCSEIWARGLRNPFRMSLDPNVKDKTKLVISDVGGKVWEEMNDAGTDYRGADYGYQEYEGPCKRHSSVDCPIPADYQEPFHYYIHRSGSDGGCVAGNAVVPDGIGWPEEYTFLFIDYVYLHIYSLFEDPEHECRDCIPPVSAFRNESFHESIHIPGAHKNEARMLDMFFGPYLGTQALYVIRFGRFDNVFRIRYTGIANDPPLVEIAFEDRPYQVGETVQFDGSGAVDPDGDEITYEWFFGDDGVETSNEMSPIHVYDSPGQYKVTLIVTDTAGQAQQKSTTIVVGTIPTANILLPEEGQQFSVGQVLRLQGEAFHANGTAFAPSQLLWEVRKHHADHWHPFLDPFDGNDFDLYPAPEPEDFFASTNSYLEIILYAIDENGLTGEVNRLVQPMMVPVGIDSSPSAMKVVVDSETITAFEQVWSWKDQEITLEVEDQPPFIFQRWSDGDTSLSKNVVLNMTSPIFVAHFCVSDGGSCLEEEHECCQGVCNPNGICGEGFEAPDATQTPSEMTNATDASDVTSGTDLPIQPPTATPTQSNPISNATRDESEVPEATETPVSETTSDADDTSDATSTTTSPISSTDNSTGATTDTESDGIPANAANAANPDNGSTLSAGGKAGISLVVIGVLAAGAAVFLVLRKQGSGRDTGSDQHDKLPVVMTSPSEDEAGRDISGTKSVAEKTTGSDGTPDFTEVHPIVGVESALL